MIDLAITVTLEGETEPFTARPNTGTLLAMEEHYGAKIESAIAAIQTMRLEYITFLAWECQRRAGQTVPPFEQYRRKVVDIEFENNSEAPLAVEEPPTP